MSKYSLNSVSYEIVEQTGSTNTDLLERIRKHGLKTIVARQALIQTQGRGTFVMEPLKYQEVPKSIAEKIIGERSKRN